MLDYNAALLRCDFSLLKLFKAFFKNFHVIIKLFRRGVFRISRLGGIVIVVFLVNTMV